jgi:hypothetical protein
MNNQDVIALIEELNITVDRKTEFGPVEIVEVKLWFGDAEISSGSCNIDTND